MYSPPTQQPASPPLVDNEECNEYECKHHEYEHHHYNDCLITRHAKQLTKRFKEASVLHQAVRWNPSEELQLIHVEVESVEGKERKVSLVGGKGREGKGREGR